MIGANRAGSSANQSSNYDGERITGPDIGTLCKNHEPHMPSLIDGESIQVTRVSVLISKVTKGASRRWKLQVLPNDSAIILKTAMLVYHRHKNVRKAYREPDTTARLVNEKRPTVNTDKQFKVPKIRKTSRNSNYSWIAVCDASASASECHVNHQVGIILVKEFMCQKRQVINLQKILWMLVSCRITTIEKDLESKKMHKFYLEPLEKLWI